MKDEQFYRNLRDLRTKKGLTQKEVAGHLNVVQSAYGKLECGKRYPRLDQLRKLSQIFAIDIGDLIAEEAKHSDTKNLQNMNSQELINRIDLLEKIFCYINPTGLIKKRLNIFNFFVILLYKLLYEKD